MTGGNGSLSAVIFIFVLSLCLQIKPNLMKQKKIPSNLLRAVFTPQSTDLDP